MLLGRAAVNQFTLSKSQFQAPANPPPPPPPLPLTSPVPRPSQPLTTLPQPQNTTYNTSCHCFRAEVTGACAPLASRCWLAHGVEPAADRQRGDGESSRKLYTLRVCVRVSTHGPVPKPQATRLRSAVDNERVGRGGGVLDLFEFSLPPTPYASHGIANVKKPS